MVNESTVIMPRPNSPRSSTSSPTTDQTAAEDLKAFERRLIEVINSMRPQTKMWRYILGVSALATVIGAIQFVRDPAISQPDMTHSAIFSQHWFFILSSFILLILFFVYGIHLRIVAPRIMVDRIRPVLADFNMSCDENGRLILNPRPVATS